MVAYRVTDIGLGDYRIHFHDSRLHSVVVGWHEGEPFKAAVRAAVLLQIDLWLAEQSISPRLALLNLRGPLSDWRNDAKTQA
jgi:hypothetical protein